MFRGHQDHGALSSSHHERESPYEGGSNTLPKGHWKGLRLVEWMDEWLSGKVDG